MEARKLNYGDAEPELHTHWKTANGYSIAGDTMGWSHAGSNRDYAWCELGPQCFPMTELTS